ncbi:hypothetical protein [Cohaesibacter haloalkalitolerans]|uniref:hypothetical protein n=1 Tax=Cohaesibacter haloalkalitolerans TaxID=1162980 RepID=UPI001FDFC2D8|nr:hypothetical protein [Cohaesibacter haloalkalitolerans]
MALKGQEHVEIRLRQICAAEFGNAEGLNVVLRQKKGENLLVGSLGAIGYDEYLQNGLFRIDLLKYNFIDDQGAFGQGPSKVTMVAFLNSFAAEVTNSLPVSQSRRSSEWGGC